MNPATPWRSTRCWRARSARSPCSRTSKGAFATATISRPNWLSASRSATFCWRSSGRNGRRSRTNRAGAGLDNPGDWVRVEIAAALKAQKRVIPVLVNGAPFPQAQDLPPDISDLARKHARKLSNDSFTPEAEHFASRLQEILEEIEAERNAEDHRPEDRCSPDVQDEPKTSKGDRLPPIEEEPMPDPPDDSERDGRISRRAFILGRPINNSERDRPISKRAFILGGTTLAAAGGVVAWQTQPGWLESVLRQPTETRAVPVLSGHSDAVLSAVFSPDGQRVLSGSRDGTLRLWDITTGDEIWTVDGTGLVGAVAVSPDGRTALTGEESGLRLRDITQGDVIWDVAEGFINAVAFSPDGRTALSDGDTAALWDVETGEEIRRFTGASDGYFSVAFSQDGGWALTGGSHLVLWDVETGARIREFDARSWINSVAVSPTEWTVVSGSNDGSLRLWDLRTGAQLRMFGGHAGWVNSVAFSPDGQRVISGGIDMTVRFWDVATGEQVENFEGHTGWVNSVAISPDGETALSGSADGTIRLWDLRGV